MERNLIISGGIYHPFSETSAAMGDLLRPVGIESVITEDVHDGIAQLARDKYRLVTFNALRWRMLNHEKYRPFLRQWQFELSLDAQQTLTDFVTAGGGLLGLHTASICFDTWPEWRDLLGAAWNWDRSFHPDPAPVTVRPTADRHPITVGIDPFTLTDELYHHLVPAPDAVPLLEADAPEGRQPQQLMFAHQVGAGRSVYTALGHDRDALEHPTQVRVLQRAAAWLLGRSDSEVSVL